MRCHTLTEIKIASEVNSSNLTTDHSIEEAIVDYESTFVVDFVQDLGVQKQANYCKWKKKVIELRSF